MLPNHLLDLGLHDWLHAERAAVQLRLVHPRVCVEEISEARFVHLVQFVARKLYNLFPGPQVIHADGALALTHLRALENLIDRATKPRGLPLDETLIRHLIIGLTLSDGFSANNREPALVLEFATAHQVIFEIVELTKLVFNEVEVDHPVFEHVLAVWVIDALVTAASEQGVDEEDGKA